MATDERNGKDRIEMTLDYSAADPDKGGGGIDPGLPKGNAFMQGIGGGFLQLHSRIHPHDTGYTDTPKIFPKA